MDDGVVISIVGDGEVIVGVSVPSVLVGCGNLIPRSIIVNQREPAVINIDAL